MHNLSVKQTGILLIVVLALFVLGSSNIALGDTLTEETDVIFEVIPGYSLTFEVQDEDNDPLEGAEVEVDGVGTETTNVDGEAVFPNLIPGTYDYTITKDDYESISDTVEIDDDDVTETVTLDEIPDPDPPTPTPPPVVTGIELSIEVEGEGTTNPESGTHTYREGREITIEAIPDDGWLFHQWLVDGEVSDVDEPELTVMMDDDKEVTTVFVADPVVLPSICQEFDPDHGGILAVEGLFCIDIPAAAIDHTTEVCLMVLEADPAEICSPDGPVDGRVFEITAHQWVNDDEEPLEQFEEFVEVQLHWEEDLAQEDAERILIHYHQEKLQMWIPVPSQVDLANRQVTAEIDRPADLVMCIKDTLADIEGHWAERYIRLLTEVGPIDGFPGMTFRPDQLVNREQFAKMLVEAAGLEVPSVVRTLPFRIEDADAVSNWAEPFVETAMLAGLIEGFEDGTFRPDETVTRAQVATMLSRALDLTPVAELPFADANEIPNWAAGHVAALSKVDIIRGYLVDGEYYFRPDVVTTRAEAAAFLTRYLKERLTR